MDFINAKLTGAMSANELANEIRELAIIKQDKLISGTNIKTINNESLVGSGNVHIVDGQLAEKLTATVSVGGIPAGTVFPKGTTIEAILRELFKTNLGYTLYYGVSPEIPAGVEPTFTQADVPEDFITNGYSCNFTTASPLYEEGQYCTFIYPANFGSLSHIYCNGLVMFDLIDNWTKQDITINGISFYMYTQNIRTKETASTYQFLF